MSNAVDIRAMLKKGTVLQGKYRIEEYLSSGGFGNTYLATHLNLEIKVVVKEFYMKGVTSRRSDHKRVRVGVSDNKDFFLSQKKKFKKEAQRLWKLQNDHIIKVYDLFEENDTIYYTMDYIDGQTLGELMSGQGQPLQEKVVIDVLSQMLDALKAVHDEGMLHMDIKPGNILIDKNGHCTLIDFGSSKQTDKNAGSTTSTTMSYTPGFAPTEQMNGLSDKWGPWTDFYALGATCYNLLTGKRPPLVDEIYEGNDNAFLFGEEVSQGFRDLIQWMMSPAVSKRPQTIDDIRIRLNHLYNPPDTPHLKDEHPADNDAESRDDENVHSEPVGESAEEDTADDAVPIMMEDTPVDVSENVDESTKDDPERMVVEVLPDDHRKERWKNIAYLSFFCLLGLVLIAGLVYAVINVKNGKDAGQEGASQELADSMAQKPFVPYNGWTDTIKVNGVAFNMVFVEAGTFTMGAKAHESDSLYDDEKPAHQVTLSSYLIGQTEVTQQLWEAVMNANPSRFKYPQKPVERVSWNDVQRFLQRLNSLTGKQFRLPTEAEWEYAARGGGLSKNTRYAGGENLGSLAWYEKNSYKPLTMNDKNFGTHLVATKKSNELGLYDMAGNVWEWCNDRFGAYSNEHLLNPKGPDPRHDNEYRVRRGGGWFNQDWACRITYRFSYPQDQGADNIGFRIALSSPFPELQREK